MLWLFVDFMRQLAISLNRTVGKQPKGKIQFSKYGYTVVSVRYEVHTSKFIDC